MPYLAGFDGDPNVNPDTGDEEDVMYVGLRQNQSGGAALLSRVGIAWALGGQAGSFVREAGSTKEEKRALCVQSAAACTRLVDSDT